MRYGSLVVSLSLSASSLALVACGGGGGSAAIEGLEPPSQVSVVTPADEPGALPADPGFPADSDYYADASNVHVYDPAIEPLSIVNEILCLVTQTASGALVNEGAYKAQVNETICRQGEDESDDETGQSSANVDEFSIWTVVSERASNTAPQFVNLWIPEEDEGQALTIFADMELTHGVDDLRPFGEFELHFAGAEDEASLYAPVFGGTLAASVLPSDLAGFELFFRHGDISQVPAPNDSSEETGATVAVQSGQVGGSAHILHRQRYDFGGGDSGIQTTEYLVAFDETHFLRAVDGGAPQPFHRDQFHENVWRYNLYHASGEDAGERVELQSGFGFRTAGGDYCWMGYWGLWAPEGAAVQDGDTVTRDVYGQEAETYMVVRAPGRLIRHTRQQLDLTALDGHTFHWWYHDPVLGPTEYVVEYDPLAAQWQKIGVRDPSTNVVTPIVPPVAIDTAALGFLNMWSESLGGPSAYVDGDAFVTYWAQQFVNGSDPVFAGGDLALLGLVQCLRPGITAAEAEGGDVFFPDAPDVGSPYAYTFQPSDLTLYEQGGSDPIGLAAGQVPASGPFVWGMRSGPLVTSTAGLTNVWDAWNAAEFYVWETGPNQWNQYAGLKDGAGDFVVFDPPLTFNYVHATADDRNESAAFDGQTFFLSYGGPGQLWGLPQEAVDLDADGNPDRWYPIVSLEDGVLLGPNGIEYVVKAIDIEQTLAPDPAYAGSLDLADAAALNVPTAAIYAVPAIGPMPVVDGPPRVVQGVVVGGTASQP